MEQRAEPHRGGYPHAGGGFVAKESEAKAVQQTQAERHRDKVGSWLLSLQLFPWYCPCCLTPTIEAALGSRKGTKEPYLLKDSECLFNGCDLFWRWGVCHHTCRIEGGG